MRGLIFKGNKRSYQYKRIRNEGRCRMCFAPIIWKQIGKKMKAFDLEGNKHNFYTCSNA